MSRDTPVIVRFPDTTNFCSASGTRDGSMYRVDTAREKESGEIESEGDDLEVMAKRISTL